MSNATALSNIRVDLASLTRNVQHLTAVPLSAIDRQELLRIQGTEFKTFAMAVQKLMAKFQDAPQ